MWNGLMENGFVATVFEITNKVENKDEHVETQSHVSSS